MGKITKGIKNMFINKKMHACMLFTCNNTFLISHNIDYVGSLDAIPFKFFYHAVKIIKF